jgi:hypothetical protein
VKCLLGAGGGIGARDAKYVNDKYNVLGNEDLTSQLEVL